MAPHATVDVVFSLPAHAACTLSLAGPHPSTTPLRARLESSATHVQGSIAAELGGRSVLRSLPRLPFSPGLNTWSVITSPEGIASFLNHQEHFRLSGAHNVSFAHLRALRVTGVAVANASLGR